MGLCSSDLQPRLQNTAARIMSTPAPNFENVPRVNPKPQTNAASVVALAGLKELEGSASSWGVDILSADDFSTTNGK